MGTRSEKWDFRLQITTSVMDQIRNSLVLPLPTSKRPKQQMFLQTLLLNNTHITTTCTFLSLFRTGGNRTLLGSLNPDTAFFHRFSEVCCPRYQLNQSTAQDGRTIITFIPIFPEQHKHYISGILFKNDNRF